MEGTGNVNVNGISERDYFNVKDNVKGDREKQRRWAALQHAKHLQSKFGAVADGSLGFLRKCFNEMSEDVVWQIYEQATRSKKPGCNHFAYFLWLAKRQMEINDQNGA